MMEEKSLQQKVDAHETRINNLEIRTALSENNIENLDKKLDKIDASLNKLTWIIVTAVIFAVLNLVFKGGVIH